MAMAVAIAIAIIQGHIRRCANFLNLLTTIGDMIPTASHMAILTRTHAGKGPDEVIPKRRSKSIPEIRTIIVKIPERIL